MCHLRMLDNQAFIKVRMSSDLIINATLFLPKKWRTKPQGFTSRFLQLAASGNRKSSSLNNRYALIFPFAMLY